MGYILILSFVLVFVFAAVIYYHYRIDENEKNERNLLHKSEFICASLLKTDFFIIDSNIWMYEGELDEYKISDFGYGELLHLVLYLYLKKFKKVILMPNFQFDEICNIKKKPKKDKVGRVSLAMRRIEGLQLQGLLKINNLEFDPIVGSYADPKIIKLLINEARKNKTTALFSNDADLRVRVREIFRSLNLPEPVVISTDDFGFFYSEVSILGSDGHRMGYGDVCTKFLALFNKYNNVC